jgi:tetratricopeptide (TPR) repeat protein
MKSFIEETIARKTEDNRLEVIDKLLYFEEYPNSYHKRIRSEVGTIYYEMGLVAEKQLKYFDAEKLFRLSSQYNPELEAQVTSELNGMVGKMINYGNNLLKERKVAEALKIYQLTFSILPDNPSAHNAIKIAEEKKASIEEAKAISLKAEQSEKDKKYQEAFNLYKQAYAKDPIKEYSDKVFTMESLIEIEKDAVGFARKIISSYNNGRITSSLRKIEETLRDNFGDDVNTSGWRIMLSTGTHRYEVRYDITSKGESFYFIWQVNLLTRQITPLNKESKEAME